MQLFYLITDSLTQRNGRCRHLFAKIKAAIWKVQRRQHTLCTLTSCGIDVMPSFSWYQICRLTAVDKSGISACADIWRGAALEQWKPRCKLHLSLTTWVAVYANYSITFCQKKLHYSEDHVKTILATFLKLDPSWVTACANAELFSHSLHVKRSTLYPFAKYFEPEL